MRREPGAEGSLRHLINQRLDELAGQLADLRIALEHMAKSTVVSYHEFDMLKLQIASLAEATHELELRVDALEKHAGLATWLTRQIGTVLVLAAAAWLIGVLT